MNSECRLYRFTHKQTGRVDILRHVDTTTDGNGKRIFWLALPEDPMQCRMPMTEAEIREYAGVKLAYLGRWPDLTGQEKHWFQVPLGNPEGHVVAEER